MTKSFNNTLLALSLALKDLETPLSVNEHKAFRDAAERLQLERDNWEEYEPDLIAVIQANPKLNQLYQAAKSQLDSLNGEIPSDLLPTRQELQEVIPTPETPQLRGFAPVGDDNDSHEINNLVINILATPNPPETAKKISRLEKLQQFLKQAINRK